MLSLIYLLPNNSSTWQLTLTQKSCIFLEIESESEFWLTFSPVCPRPVKAIRRIKHNNVAAPEVVCLI